MSLFSKLLAVLKGVHSFPQPFRSNALLALFFACAISTQFAAAQTGGRIAGAVKDATGAVVPGSRVVLVNPANGVKQNAVTGNDGVFTFAAVPVGQYELASSRDDQGWLAMPRHSAPIVPRTALECRNVWFVGNPEVGPAMSCARA